MGLHKKKKFNDVEFLAVGVRIESAEMSAGCLGQVTLGKFTHLNKQVGPARQLRPEWLRSRFEIVQVLLGGG